MGRLKILVISYLVFFTLLATTCYVILYLFHPIYEPTIGDPIGSMWLARMMYKGEIGDCEGLTCSYGGVKVYFGENEWSLEVKLPVPDNYTWFKTDILNYPAIRIYNITQKNLNWAVEYNRAHTRVFYIGRFTFNFTVYMSEEPPQPYLLTYKGEEEELVGEKIARLERVRYTLLYPSIRPGILVEGSEWAKGEVVLEGQVYKLLVGYYYNYTLLLNGRPVLKSPLSSIIYLQNGDTLWASVWPMDGDLAYTEDKCIQGSRSIKNALTGDYTEVLGSLRRGWNNLTLIVDVHVIDDAIDPVQGTRYITARPASGAIVLKLGPPFIMILEARRVVDSDLYFPILVACIPSAFPPAYIVYRVRGWVARVLLYSL